ncbi:MAG: hypothetical protein ACLUD2_11980 [Clostridium sp.]
MPHGRFDIDVHAAFKREGVKSERTDCIVDDETVIRMVGKGAWHFHDVRTDDPRKYG